MMSLRQTHHEAGIVIKQGAQMKAYIILMMNLCKGSPLQRLFVKFDVRQTHH